jgi:hypothetical protein
MRLMQANARRVLISVAAVAVVGLAFYIGGVVGFSRGFLMGNQVAHIAAGNTVVADLRRSDTSSRRESSVLLESIIDQALISYERKRELGPSQFNQLGYSELDGTVEAMMRRITEYRRTHPRVPAATELAPP